MIFRNRWLVILLLLCGICAGKCDNFDDGADYHKIVSHLRAQPKEDIRKFPDVDIFLKTYPVYISLTTSPTRISKIGNVFNTLDTELVDSILLSLPEHFGRDNSLYEIPESISMYPKVKILREKHDYGPITKIMYAVEYLKRKGIRDGVLISVDDDIGYPFGTPSQLVKTVILNGGAASTQTNQISAFHLDERLWPRITAASWHDKVGATSADIIEGWGAVAYRLNIFTDDVVADLKKHSSKSQKCFVSDDLVISYTLASHGVPRWLVKNGFAPHVIPFEYGKQGDALHKGAGQENPEVGGMGGNGAKYKTCFQDLVK